jgi:hypothetical protein
MPGRHAGTTLPCENDGQMSPMFHIHSRTATVQIIASTDIAIAMAFSKASGLWLLSGAGAATGVSPSRAMVLVRLLRPRVDNSAAPTVLDSGGVCVGALGVCGLGWLVRVEGRE